MKDPGSPAHAYRKRSRYVCVRTISCICEPSPHDSMTKRYRTFLIQNLYEKHVEAKITKVDGEPTHPQRDGSQQVLGELRVS